MGRVDACTSVLTSQNSQTPTASCAELGAPGVKSALGEIASEPVVSRLVHEGGEGGSFQVKRVTLENASVSVPPCPFLHLPPP